ncbi:MAG: hypothetical protein ACPF9D_07950, partial [Owenweeksia sp.]
MIRKSIISLFLTGLVLVVFYRGALMNEIDDARVNSEFEQRASVADNISIEFLTQPLPTGENAKYTVAISDPLVTTPYHAIYVDENKVVLRDDGVGADDIAGDKIYSVYTTEDIQMFSQEMQNRRDLVISGEASLFTSGRSLIDPSHPSLSDVHNSDFTNIQPGVPVNIPMALLGPVVPGGGAGNKVSGTSSIPVLIDHSLMITDPSVIEDPTRTYDPCTGGNPNGDYTLWELMRQMASINPGSIATDLQTSDFIKKWLDNWTFTQTINGDVVDQRPLVNNIIQNWESFPGGPLDPKSTDFKLSAIVLRSDLRGNSGYGVSDAGEVRFVFQLLNTNACFPERFLLILEYGINIDNCTDLHGYFTKW